MIIPYFLPLLLIRNHKAKLHFLSQDLSGQSLLTFFSFRILTISKVFLISGILSSSPLRRAEVFNSIILYFLVQTIRFNWLKRVSGHEVRSVRLSKELIVELAGKEKRDSLVKDFKVQLRSCPSLPLSSWSRLELKEDQGGGRRGRWRNKGGKIDSRHGFLEFE